MQKIIELLSILLLQIGLYQIQVQRRAKRIAIFASLASYFTRKEPRASNLDRYYYWNRYQNVYTDEQFRRTFRLTRSTFNSLCDDLYLPVKGTNKYVFGRERIDKKFMVAVFLYRLANPSTTFRIGDNFGISESSVVRITKLVSDAIFEQIGPKEIFFPSKATLVKESEAWSQKTGFPNPVGAIDGSHIPIQRPQRDWEQFFTRKHQYAIHCQAVVDRTGLFSDFLVGYSGASHDARVFALSPLASQAEKIIPPGYFILGDSAYPNKSWLLTTYKHSKSIPLSESQKLYNLVHAQTRVSVEHAFGRLKQRWRLLKFIHSNDFLLIHKLISVAAILHNYCERRNDCISKRQLKKITRRVKREIKNKEREEIQNIDNNNEIHGRDEISGLEAREIVTEQLAEGFIPRRR